MALVKQQAERAIAPYKQESILQETKYIPTPVLQLTGNTGPINECEFSPNGQMLATCAGEVIFWNVNTSDKKIESRGAIRPHKNPITSLSWYLDSTKLATGSADNTVAVVDVQTGQTLRRWRDHKGIVNTVAFFRNNPDLLVSGDDSKKIKIYDIRDRDPILVRGSRSPVVSISTAENKIAVGGVCGTLFVDLVSDKSISTSFTEPSGNIIFGTALNSTAELAATLDCDGCMRLFSCGSFSHGSRLLAERLEGTAEREVVPTRCTFSPDNIYLMCGSTDRILRIWNVENPREPDLIYALPGHKGSVTGVAFHPTLPIIASCSTDETAIIGEL